MNQSIHKYETQKEISHNELRFYFISNGSQHIIKVVHYSYAERLQQIQIKELDGKKVYNLGFGDYNLDADDMVDDRITLNGDPYKVFNTVLNTIPVFFQHYPAHLVIVQGSDGTPEFMASCRRSCTKNCNVFCRKFNRRMTIYRKYIDKYYDQLCIDYQFFGGVRDEQNKISISHYICGENYDAVLFRKIS